MIRGANLLNPASWPLAIKFAVLILVVAFLLAAIAVSTNIQATAELTLRSASSLVSEIGARQEAVINGAVNLAREVTVGFVEANQADLQGLLLRDVVASDAINLPDVTSSEITTRLREDLLLQPSSLFESVRLIDQEGGVLAQAVRSTPLAGDPSGQRAPAYIAGSNAALQGEDRAVSVSQVNFTPVVEMIEVLRWRDGSPLGYLVTRLNNRRAFFDAMGTSDGQDSLELITFLISSNDVLISPAGVRPELLAYSQSVAVDRALAGQDGSALYNAGDDVEYIGYYTPLRGLPLALVSQVSTASIIQRATTVVLTQRFGGVVGLLAVMIVAGLLFNQLVTPSVNRLRRAVLTMAYGDLNTQVPETKRQDEIGALASGIETLRDQIRGQISELQAGVESRSRDLDATQEVSRFAATQRDLQRLMDSVVNLIIQRFPNIYHAQIFLIDADGQDAVLRASTGTVGQELLRRGHRLGVGSVSVIGQVTSQGQIVVARDTAVSQVHRRNEFLPDTRAELAVALRVGDIIIGALDVQSRERDAFNEAQVAVLQTMADQIAVAIQNARLYEDLSRRLQDIEDRNRAATLRAWQDFMRERRAVEITREAGLASDADFTDIRQTALKTGELAIARTTARQTIPIAVPVSLRGQILGAVEWEIPVGVLTEDRLELARELAGRLALSLDNARLFQESQRTAERERVVNAIVAKLTAQTSINDILQTAVREVGQALRAPQVSIRLETRSENGSTVGDSGGGIAENNGHAVNGNGSNR
ncbi:MAG: GAF domain-containing protein [Chloroflexi bacterium]|nr:GAF domain-containing protein [Chloroflexota bacterium]